MENNFSKNSQSILDNEGVTKCRHMMRKNIGQNVLGRIFDLAGVPVVGFYKSIEELENVLGVYIGEKFNASRGGEKELANKIKKVLSIDFCRELLRQKVIDNLSWDVKFHEFESVYTEVLAR